MASATYSTLRTRVVSAPSLQHKDLKVKTAPNLLRISNLPNRTPRPLYIRHAGASRWEPAAPCRYEYADPDENIKLRQQTGNIIDTTLPTIVESSKLSITTKITKAVTRSQFLKWPLCLLGSAVLVATGVAPTIWLPLSSVFVGPNIASLLALTGLDCIFNFGATLFLIIADFIARPNTNVPNKSSTSKPPLSFRLWNLLAHTLGFIIPLATLHAAQKKLLKPLPHISYLILFGPYFLLLGIQMLSETLAWLWESPVWLVTPVIYESYRLLQLIRGLILAVELGPKMKLRAPLWTIHTMVGLICGWVLVLGMQIMQMALYAGSSTARSDNR